MKFEIDHVNGIHVKNLTEKILFKTVSVSYWNFVWLNEGLATLFQLIGMDTVINCLYHWIFIFYEINNFTDTSRLENI